MVLIAVQANITQSAQNVSLANRLSNSSVGRIA